jgi:hypothetical protein
MQDNHLSRKILCFYMFLLQLISKSDMAFHMICDGSQEGKFCILK